MQIPGLDLNGIELFIVIFFGAVVIFFVSRELFTWYWKINKVIQLLEKIEENTKK